MMLTGEMYSMGLTSPTWISRKNASLTAARVDSALALGTAKQMECSELAWAIMTTLTPVRCRHAKSFAAAPTTPARQGEGHKDSNVSSGHSTRSVIRGGG
jgi:hypothetical protein